MILNVLVAEVQINASMQYIGNNDKRAVAHGATWLLLLPINVSRGCRAGYSKP